MHKQKVYIPYLNSKIPGFFHTASRCRLLESNHQGFKGNSPKSNSQSYTCFYKQTVFTGCIVSFAPSASGFRSKILTYTSCYLHMLLGSIRPKEYILKRTGIYSSCCCSLVLPQPDVSVSSCKVS